jgi:hypothetical protein
MLKNGGTRHWIPEMEVPYIVKGDQWISYDDKQSLQLKVRIYLIYGILYYMYLTKISQSIVFGDTDRLRQE